MCFSLFLICIRDKDWADLPPELTCLISKKLPDVTDFIRFRAVCKTWRSSAPPYDLPLQLPWLLESCATCNDDYIPKTMLEEGLHFYSIATAETGTLPVKKLLSAGEMSYHGPCRGYLLLVAVYNEAPLWRWNPLTDISISFPLLPCFQTSWPIWTGSDPILSGNVIFMGWECENYDKLGCWAYHPGKAKWNVMKGCLDRNCCFWDGTLYTTKGGCDTKVLDLSSQKLVYEILSPEHQAIGLKSYLVEILGVIMRVCRYLRNQQNVEGAIFHFYELHFQGRNRKPSWVKVSDIGNHMLFLDRRGAFSMKQIAGLKGNCVYFLSCQGNTPCRYDIATGTFQRVPCHFEACTWFLPSLC